jgi:hypothetical protein
MAMWFMEWLPVFAIEPEKVKQFIQGFTAILTMHDIVVFKVVSQTL